MNLLDAKNYTEQMIKEHLSDGWSFKWNNRKTAYGMCYHRQQEIRLSKVLTEIESVEAVQQTVLHEIAHAIVGPGHGHGAVWKRTAYAIGVHRPRATKKSSAPDHKQPKHSWVVMLGDEVIHGYYRRPNFNTFLNISEMWVKGRPETKGQLRLVQAAA